MTRERERIKSENGSEIEHLEILYEIYILPLVITYKSSSEAGFFIDKMTMEE